MNYLLLTIPAAAVLIFAPKFTMFRSLLAKDGKYDNASPRDQQARLDGAGRRAVAAHANGFESFPMFAAGVLIAHVSGARPQLALALACVHLVARALYPIFYIGNLDKLRSSTWFIGFGTAFGLMLLPLATA
jgi:uncharacterized MAPEG superfamily protein